MKNYLIAAFIPLLLFGCNRSDKPAKETAIALVPPPKAYDVPSQKAIGQVRFPPPVVAADNEVTEKPDAKLDAVDEAPSSNALVKDTSKKIIKQGDIHFETKNIANTQKALLRSLESLGGYAEEDNESLDSGADRKEYNIKARIPAKNFDRFFDDVSISAIRVDSKHCSVSDVTTEYIDMATRLKNQKILENSYLGLLKRASKMADVLEIEDKLTDTRSEIESEQGQLNYLGKQIAYSTLDITFYTKQIQPDIVAGQGYRLSSAISDGWILLQGLFFGLIAIWPLLILSIVMILLYRRWRKNRKTTPLAKTSV